MAFVDPYIDSKTGILRNLVNAKTYQELREAEGNIAALSEISLENIPHTLDLGELRAIHRGLFGKIYDWAGELRTVDIRKGGEEYFLDCGFLENGAKFVFDELRKEDNLRGLKKVGFVKRLAYFYEQLNFIHPFREGNGRAQRIFWQRVAGRAGYRIDWSEVIGDELDNASLIGRVENNLEPLERMFERIVTESHENNMAYCKNS